MLLLSFETSAKAGSVALTEDAKLLAESYQNTGMTHSQTLMVMAEDMLKNAEMKLSDVDLIAVAHGPGSFTGLRIGASIVNTLAHELRIPLYDHKGQKHDQIIPDYGRAANISKPVK